MSAAAAAASEAVTLRVNGRLHALPAAAHGGAEAATLLQALRNDVGLNGPKFGCGLGECGACAVLIDGRLARACVIPAAWAVGREVTTIEGLAGAAGALHPVQQAYIDAQAAQCGYCTNGMVMATVALLRRHPQPGEAQIREALDRHLCRCGAHVEILQAVQRAAELTNAAAAATPVASAGFTDPAR